MTNTNAAACATANPNAPEGSLKARPLPTLNFVATRAFQAAHASKRKP